MKREIILIGTLLLLFLVACKTPSTGPGETFAKCLTENGVKMYGAFWCPHCNDQKDAFGDDWEHITYIECSKPDKTQTEYCSEAGITSYPTWEFADGTREVGKLTFATLSQRSECNLG